MAKIAEAELRTLVATVANVPEERITPDTRFVADLHMDSITSLDLLTELEDEHGIEITQEEARDIKTFGQLLAHVSAA